ncbi:methyl-accepting chemotaxis protein [Picosynechococcus sp. NKBG15041c]|uniref:methyl-accepting chemotaxis protein n=1 Tax=Picosynechococcus sp. NKBG15041c TaxID=1407650 RepID=UPI000424A8A7|nr:methyl-accepting chemotaxis protein [Picosynechococcus sp. NKBG15041c]
MPPSATDYMREYAEAQKAYYQNNLPEAEAIANQLLRDYPDDPRLLLLSGHIALGLQDLGRASTFYRQVLEATDQQDYHDYAHQGLEQINVYGQQVSSNGAIANGAQNGYGANQTLTQEDVDYPFGEADLEAAFAFDGEDEQPALDHLDDWTEELVFTPSGPLREDDDETFLVPHANDEHSLGAPTSHRLDAPFFTEETEEFIEFNEDELVEFDTTAGSSTQEDTLGNYDDGPLGLDLDLIPPTDYTQGMPTQATLLMGTDDPSSVQGSIPWQEDSGEPIDAGLYSDFGAMPPQENGDFDDDISLGSLGAELFEAVQEPPKQEEGGFLEEFGILNDQDIESLGDFGSDILEDDQDMPDTSLFESSLEGTNTASFNFDDFPGELAIAEDDNLFAALSEDNPPGTLGVNFTVPEKGNEAVIVPSKSYLAWFENVPLQKKQLFTATGAAAASAIATLIVIIGILQTTPSGEQRQQAFWPVAKTGLLTSLFAGAASFGTTFFFGRLTSKQIKRSTDNLQEQFDAVSQGNLNVKATVFAEDEFGVLATGFNKMARVILNTTSEAQRRAEETEQSKEDLQRQVIRLLDDVEGAARGDFTVQAEVTADVLGAVADAFNLTIQNLREIVQQVKQAARQVNKNAADSESFARGLSSDALRQAEELAVTLNSVQMMTDSIQRVAENAREAEEVARTASSTALKGGESVEHTVAGILQIRETVAETARKVKRLAESSQEISKIVAVVSQIASRTNLLALNASIEAARAGESGKGFAIVADEVRQLADRSAKALKEIEQIVLQIQSETSLVMTAMEEGTQQVIDGTKRAEQAKQSLDDIIQVSNRIDALVRSITADTVEQRENSRAVAQVMQSVELTAQETSRESQRVAGSLQKLVVIARDLSSSVDRFRVEASDEA